MVGEFYELAGEFFQFTKIALAIIIILLVGIIAFLYSINKDQK